jgi:hypothetical protein
VKVNCSEPGQLPAIAFTVTQRDGKLRTERVTFIAAAQQPQTEKEAVVLSSDEMAALDEGIRSAKTDQRYTLEESFDFARLRRGESKNAPATLLNF